MTQMTLSLSLPSEIYNELEQRARQHQRPLEDEAAMTLTAALNSNALPDDLTMALDALTSLDDETLWRVSQSQPTVEDGVLLDALVDKRRRKGLSSGDEKLLAELVDRHDRVMALRAEAVSLLKERGIDVREQVARA